MAKTNLEEGWNVLQRQAEQEQMFKERARMARAAEQEAGVGKLTEEEAETARTRTTEVSFQLSPGPTAKADTISTAFRLIVEQVLVSEHKSARSAGFEAGKQAAAYAVEEAFKEQLGKVMGQAFLNKLVDAAVNAKPQE